MATWHVDFSRKHPGRLVKDLMDKDPVPGVAALAEAAADVILLTDVDYDAGHVALSLLQDQLRDFGQDYPYRFATRPNTGMSTGLDLDQDGKRGGPRDAQGYGWFSGQGGLAVLSRFPVSLVQNHSELLWKDVPDSAMRADDTGRDVQRLSSAAHWALDVELPEGGLTLLTLAATPPVFDGPEDRNGRRNRDEVMLWIHALDGRLDALPKDPVVVLGLVNIDPERGDGDRATAARLLAHPSLQDPLPGQPTVTFASVGEMRVSYVLPDSRLTVEDAGIAPVAHDAGRHQLVWVDLHLP